MALSRRTISVVTVVVLAGALGTGIWWRLRSKGEGEGDTAQAGATTAAAPADSAAEVEVPSAMTFSADQPDPVEGAAAVRDTLWIYVHAPARARAVRRTVVTSLVEGVVDEVAVRENSSVSAGQTLVRIDTTELALQVERARSQVFSARADFQWRTMFDEEEIADPEARRQRAAVARVTSGLDDAEAALEEAERQLRRAVVGAPFAGRVADVSVRQGEYVSAGTELMTVLTLDPIEVEADVLESAVPDLREGREAEVTFAAFPGETFTGRILSINPVISPARRASRVRVRMANPGGRIKPGMYARVALQSRGYPDRVLVPRAAILERGEGHRRPMLFVYEDGLAKWRYVTPGLENDRVVEIVPNEETDSVMPGEIVLVDGHHYLAHDTRVRLVESVFQAGGRPGG